MTSSFFTFFKDDSDFADDPVVVVLPIRQSTDHRMLEEFAASFRWAAALQQFDPVVGFDKLTHLDRAVYFRMRKERFSLPAEVIYLVETHAGAWGE